MHAQKKDTIKSANIDEVEIIGVKQVITDKSEYVGKIPLKNMENSQVYTGITSRLITQQKLYNIEDVVRNAPGISKSNDGGTGSIIDGGAVFVMRGFSNQIRATNGLASDIAVPTDVQNISRIEVIKGPSATLFGGVVTNYGGLINRVTKEPYENSNVAGDFSTGSYNFQRVGFDVNVPINKEKTLLSRINAAYSNQGTFMDNGGYVRSFIVAPAFSYKFKDKLKINFNTEIFSQESTGQLSGIMFSILPSSVKQHLRNILTSIGQPESVISDVISHTPNNIKEAFGTNNINEIGLDRYKSFTDKNMKANSHGLNMNFEVTYNINTNWKSVTSGIFSSGSDEGYESSLILLPNVVPAVLNSFSTEQIQYGTPGADYLARTAKKFESTVDSHDLQQNFIGDFKIGNLRNRMVIGLDYYRYNGVSNWQNFNGELFTVPFEGIFDVVKIKGDNPNYHDFEKNAVDKLLKNNLASISNFGNTTHIYSTYINDVFNISERLILNAGIRFDRFNAKGAYDATENKLIGGYNQNAFSPKFGIVYQPVLDKISLFANYQSGFKNVATTDKNGNAFKPEHAFQWETGIKFAFFNGMFTGNLSYYDIEVNDKVRVDPDNLYFNIQDGTQHSKGFEAEVLGNPIPQLNILLGYAYNDSEMTKADSTLEGLRPAGSGPYHQFNIWAHYHFTQSFLKNFSIGAGTNYVGETYIMNQRPDGAFIAPAYMLVSMKLSYDHPRYSVSFRANNLLNEEVWAGNASVYPQMPRQFIGSIAFKF
jgi:iron complex outermembrane receptor protein